jgi:alpha-L-rhamnosidase
MMLLCRDVPSWLYQVDHGATTTWERWDAIRPDGSIHPGEMSPPPGATEGGHMLSFNHYAYGAVIDWVYRNLGGISPDREAPGYRTVVFRPRPPDSIDWAETSIESDYGRTAMAWSIDGDVFEAEVELPFGTTARLDAPLTPESEQIVDGEHRSGEVRLVPGTHHIRVSSPRLATTD